MRSSSRRSSVSAGSRTSQRIAFSQKRWKARPSSPSPADRNPQCQARVGEQRQRPPLARLADDQHRRRLAAVGAQRRVGQQRRRAGAHARHAVHALERRQLGPAQLVLVRVEHQRRHRMRAPLGRQLGLKASVVTSASLAPRDAGRRRRQLDRQHVAQRGRAVAAAGERQVAADHRQRAALLDVVAHAGQERLDAVGGEVEVLEDDQVERLAAAPRRSRTSGTGSATARCGSRAARRSRCAG